VLVVRFRWRGRQVDAIAVDVELPAMEGAADAALLVAAVVKIGPAVWTVLFDDTDAAVAGAERQKLLAEDRDLPGWSVALGQLVGEQCRHPEAAQQFAHRRALAAAGQQVVVTLAQHQEVALARACFRSAMMSSTVSIPIDRRSTSGPAPAASRCSSVSWRCVVEAGWMIRLLASPMLARCENRSTLSTTFTPTS